MNRAALKRAVEAAGGQTALARKIGVAQTTLNHWLKREKGAPGEFIPAIEAATGISRHELRPDIYGPPPSPPAPPSEGAAA